MSLIKIPLSIALGCFIGITMFNHGFTWWEAAIIGSAISDAIAAAPINHSH